MSKINIWDTWKDIDGFKINIWDTWKDVESASINIWDTWKAFYSAVVPNWLLNNLVSYWKADTNGSFPDAHWSNNWTINWASFTSSWKINWWYYLDWVNDTITVPDIDIIWNCSICMWVKWTSWVSRAFFDKYSWWTNPLSLRTFSWQTFVAQMYDWSTQNAAVSSTNLSDWQWHHLAAVRDYTWWNLILYVDWWSWEWWETVSVSDTLAEDLTNNNVYTIWKVQTSGNHLNATIDEPWIWSRALSASDVATLYNSWDWLSYDNFTT